MGEANCCMHILARWLDAGLLVPGLLPIPAILVLLLWWLFSSAMRLCFATRSSIVKWELLFDQLCEMLARPPGA